MGFVNDLDLGRVRKTKRFFLEAAFYKEGSDGVSERPWLAAVGSATCLGGIQISDLRFERGKGVSRILQKVDFYFLPTVFGMVTLAS
jgi:hypothetical protein